MKEVPQHKESMFKMLRQIRYDYVLFQEKLADRYGDICYFKIWNNIVYIVSNPSYIKHILFDNRQNYIKAKRFDIAKPILGNYGILLINDYELWKKDRNIIFPLFRENYFEKYAHYIIRNCQELLDTWDTYAKKNQSINIDKEMKVLTLKNLFNTAFTHINIDLDHFGKLLVSLHTDLNTQLRSLLRLRWRLPTPTRAKHFEKVRELHQIIRQQIKSRLNSEEKLDDVLGALIEGYKNEQNRLEAEQHLMDELLILFTAGHETTAAQLIWTWVLLSKSPAVWQRLYEEINSVLGTRVPSYEDLNNLPYLHAVIYESLRMYPAVPSVLRQSVNADVIDGYPIPAQVQIDVPIYSVHRRTDYWENPQGFNPDRFLSNDINDEKYRYAFIPFGAGPRICLGKNFALVEMALIIAMIMQRYRLDLPSRFELEIAPLAVVREPQLDLKMRVKNLL